jgi:iron complex outermembrane recepter protein
MATVLYRMIRLAVAIILVLPRPTAAQSTTNPDLRTLSLQELMAIPVDTPGRVPQDRFRVSPAVFVITEDDIRRSGATTIPEVLRMVPGLHVAQIDGNKWAVGIRGFTDRLARAMLVMIDGRAVYSPLFAGTYWEVQDMPLQDIERIEVVRGPGGALWGANAVTGTINIIRKTANQSAGTTLTAGSGTADPYGVSLTYGGAQPGFQYRLSGKAAARGPQDTPGDLDYDDARVWQGGARIDWARSQSAFTVQGDIYRMVIGQRDTLTTYSPPASTAFVTDDTMTGGNVLFRWQRRASNPQSLRVQAYFDRTTRSELTFKEQQNVGDLDVQQGLTTGRHRVLFGAGYRVIDSQTETRGSLHFDPPDRVDQLYTGFVQDDVQLWPDRLTLTVGTKFEHNDYSGAEWQPSARLLWNVTPRHAVSVSASRSVRTPSRVEHQFGTGALLMTQGPTFARLSPNPRFESEVLNAYEAGVISMPHPKLLITAAGFHNRHERVLSLELDPTFVESDAGGARVIVPLRFGNGLRGTSQGIEVTADVRPMSWLQTTLNYSALRVRMERRPGSTDAGQERRLEEISPRHQVQAIATVTLPHEVSVDWFFRYVSALPAVAVPAYGTSNVTLRLALNRELSLLVSGRNLHQATHVEFAENNGVIGIRRSVYFGLRWTR